MGHAIHKHMISFKAKNLLGEMPIDNRASALEMNESAAYMNEDEGSPVKDVKYTKKNIKGKDQMVPTQHDHKSKEPGSDPKETKPTGSKITPKFPGKPSKREGLTNLSEL